MGKLVKPGRKPNRRTQDGVAILRKRYLEKDPQLARLVREERENMAVARKICDLRQSAGLSQRELARLIGTTASVICRLEDADYTGHSLGMLQRIAGALNQRIEIRFVPLKGKSTE